MIKFLKAKIGLMYFGLMLVSLLAVRSIRPYIANLLAALTVLGIFYKIYASADKRYKHALLLCIAGAVILVSMSNSATSFLKTKFDKAICQMIKNQEGFAVADDSSYSIYPSNCYVTRTCNLTEFVGGYAKGVGYVLFAPFPWRINSRLQLMAYPQIVIWYIMMLFTVYGFYLGYRSNKVATGIIFLYCLCVLSIMALAEGNVGALFRHRDMVAPFCIIYFAAGFEWIRQKYFT